ncbi:hypothetical protein RB195_024240 [Necator americanus]|uniref:Uncharacterized protein n=1 Tax=Necator americanus TaxID=51031 RepID=A0ABR1EMR7_NECAM
MNDATHVVKEYKAYENGGELFLSTCDSRGGGVGVFVNSSMAKNIDSFEELMTRTGRLRVRRCGPTLTLTIFAVRQHQGTKETKLKISIWTCKSSAEKILPSTRS